MRLRITQHGASSNECNHQGFNLFTIYNTYIILYYNLEVFKTIER